MKTRLGIIGGAGPLASALFYRLIAERCYALGDSVPEMIVLNYPFSRGIKLEESQKRGERLVCELSYCTDLLLQAGVTRLLIACNTLHLYLPHLKVGSAELIELPKEVLQAAKRGGVKRLLLLGSESTAACGLYETEGIEIVTPERGDQDLVHEVIDRILEGEIKEGDRDALVALIGRMKSLGFEGVVLGCTELSVLHATYPIDVELELFDSLLIGAFQLLGGG